MKKTTSVLFVMIALVAIAVSAEAAGLPVKRIGVQRYDLRVVSPAGENRFARGINDFGVMTGYGEDNHGYINFCNQVLDLGPNTWTGGASNNGTVCGQKDFQATVWLKGIWPIRVGPKSDYSISNAISDRNTVVGEIMIPVTSWWQEAFPFVSEINRDFDVLSAEPGDALAINNFGTIGGNVYRSNPYRSVPVLWEKHRKEYSQIDLPLPNGGTDGYVWGVNDAGQVVGTCETADGMQATAWQKTANGEYTAVYLPTPDQGWAMAINNRGQIVGNSNTAALLWMNGKTYDLNTLVPAKYGIRLFAAMAINDFGWILCDGQDQDWYTVEVILIPR